MGGPTVLVIVDGLGWTTFRAWSGRRDGPAAAWRTHAVEIDSVFPTTTAAALASFSTGAAPAAHGIVGYHQWLPTVGRVVNILKMSPSGEETPDQIALPGWDSATVRGVPTIYRRGVRATILSRSAFAGSGLTRLLYDGAEFRGYTTAAELAALLKETMLDPNVAPLVVVYWDELDTLQHFWGPGEPAVELELDGLLGRLAWVAESLPERLADGASLIISADHGQVPADPLAHVAVEREPRILSEMSRTLAGDRRCGYFAARPGRASELREAIAARVPAGARVVDAEEAISAGWFGPSPFHPELRERIGDLIVMIPSPGGIGQVVPGARAPTRFLRGAHGGLEAAEVGVPLIAGRWSELFPTGSPPGQR